MDTQRINQVHTWLINAAQISQRNCPINNADIVIIRTGLNQISEDAKNEYPYYGLCLKDLSNNLFNQFGVMNPFLCGRVLQILETLIEGNRCATNDIWSNIHPLIIKCSKSLYLDGHYPEACENAFIEINDRVKKIFCRLKPTVDSIPDGYNLFNTVFADGEKAMLKVCDNTTETGKNIHNGTRFMLGGAWWALRCPKAHSNDVVLTKEEALRRLMFASLLMYKIDEAVKYSNFQE